MLISRYTAGVVAAIDELMPSPVVPSADARKSRAHARLQHLLSGIGAQNHFAAQHEDEFLFVRMPVAHRGFLAGRQRRVIDADLREAERVAERAFLARHDARTIRLGISGTVRGVDRQRIERGFLQIHVH